VPYAVYLFVLVLARRPTACRSEKSGLKESPAGHAVRVVRNGRCRFLWIGRKMPGSCAFSGVLACVVLLCASYTRACEGAATHAALWCVVYVCCVCMAGLHLQALARDRPGV
jgi:hypothetical protein